MMKRGGAWGGARLGKAEFSAWRPRRVSEFSSHDNLAQIAASNRARRQPLRQRPHMTAGPGPSPFDPGQHRRCDLTERAPYRRGRGHRPQQQLLMAHAVDG